MDKKYKYNVDIHYKLKITRKKFFIFKEKEYIVSNTVPNITCYCSINNLILECAKNLLYEQKLFFLAWHNGFEPDGFEYNYEIIDCDCTINSKQEMTVKEAIEHYSIDEFKYFYELPIDKVIRA